jgi:predicted AAA+ superfamily ATPase
MLKYDEYIMVVCSMEKVTVLQRINRWWLTGKMDSSFLYNIAREELNEISARLDDRRIISLIGPRRVGKTTLIYQTIDYLIKSGTNPVRILMFSGDEPGLFSANESIYDILNDYTREVLHENIESFNSMVYVFIDEIHYIKDWQLYLKSMYDRQYRVKFIVSGSSSTHLFRDSRESMMGRMDDIFILPMGVWQFTRFYSEYKEDLALGALQALLPSKSLFDAPEEYYRELQQNRYKIAQFESAMNKVVKTYLLVGGYPEYFENGDILLWQKRLTGDIISRGLFRDIVGIYNIKNPEILEKILYYIAANNGGEFSFTSLAQTFGVDTVTISTYLRYLAQAFFVNVFENYSSNAGKVVRKNKKVFIADNGIRNGLLRISELSPEEEGVQIEISSIQLARSYCDPNNYSVYFWRDNQKETDIVIDKKRELLPVEVKYRNEVTERDLKGLFAFLEEHKARKGIVITKDFLSIKGDVVYIPFWMIRS